MPIPYRYNAYFQPSKLKLAYDDWFLSIWFTYSFGSLRYYADHIYFWLWNFRLILYSKSDFYWNEKNKILVSEVSHSIQLPDNNWYKPSYSRQIYRTILRKITSTDQKNLMISCVDALKQGFTHQSLSVLLAPSYDRVVRCG